MIKSYKGKIATTIASGGRPKGFPSNLIRASIRKLFMLDNASLLLDLRSPPGNKLEALKGNRKGQHSIRINQQWRVCFEWTDSGPENVEIVDYH